MAIKNPSINAINATAASVTFAQPETESLNQMRFCTISAEASNIVGGGTAHEFYYFGLADANTQHGMLVAFGEFLKQLGIRCQDIVHNPCIQDIVQFYARCIQHIV